jgi:transcriptional regulator with XRE-family HTH domain
MAVGENIREIRKQKQVSQKYLAYQVGVTRHYLSMIENGVKNPSVKLVNRLAEQLGVPLDILFKGLAFN